jgi:predicted DNA-binding transcriptional regulator YafY
MPANLRIQWLHRKITEHSYPNAKRLAERFGISHRQAQRDVDFLRDKLGAPVAFDFIHNGFYYTADFTLPVAITADNDEDYTGVVASIAAETSPQPAEAEKMVVQTQIPYAATLRVGGKLTVIELQPFIREKNKDGTYLCEFHSIEKFMSVILALDADITIIKPDWLRTRLIRAAERIIRNNKTDNK